MVYSLQHAGLALSLLSLVYYLYWQLTVGARRRAMIQEKGCLPVNRFPTKDPFFGIDLFRSQVKALRNHTLLEMSKARFFDWGVNTMAFPVLDRDIIVTIEPENLKTIQSLNFKQWSLGTRRKITFTPLLGPGIFTTDGAAWQHSRELLRPNFNRNQVRDLDSFETHVAQLIDCIPIDGSTVDLQELFFRLTIDSATEFLFGESTNCLAPGTTAVSNHRFAECFNRSQEAISKHGRYGVLGNLLPRTEFKKDAAFVHKFVDTYVEKALARRPQLLSEKQDENGRYIFINELVKETTDAYRIRSEALNILLAGRDTTASLLSNVWLMLSKRADIWNNLRAEVATLNGTPPTFAQLRELKYLRALLNESLRLHPVVPSNSREAIVDTTLPLGGGPDGKAPVFVKAGQVVVWNVYTMHRRRDYYGDDAEEFRPERWLGDKGLRPGWEYLPFNGGPRICLGQQFALTEASYTTIRLVQAFSAIESRDPEPWRESLTLTCVGFGGCKVGLSK